MTRTLPPAHRRPPEAPPPTRPAGEEGSAYIVALLVLFVLTAVGLSVAFVSQTELIVGSQERTIQRTFYAADAGLDIAAASALNTGNYEARRIDLADPAGLFGASLIDRIETSVVAPILETACNLCQINQDADYYRISHAITSRASRLGRTATAGEDVPLSVKELTAVVDFQPWRRQATATFLGTDAANRTQIRF
ncbi:MAG TPA: pilus assembly PilX N-terminal domain-containing protein [Thermoanaerobaculia bacterium]|nr:pilus assembly PilX N-terminal domain-containing protein [Thermoanaerobaculia bacterium]